MKDAAVELLQSSLRDLSDEHDPWAVADDIEEVASNVRRWAQPGIAPEKGESRPTPGDPGSIKAWPLLDRTVTLLRRSDAEGAKAALQAAIAALSE